MSRQRLLAQLPAMTHRNGLRISGLAMLAACSIAACSGSTDSPVGATQDAATGDAGATKTDASTSHDAGSTAPDATTTVPDAGGTSADSGTTALDSGTTALDSGNGPSVDASANDSGAATGHDSGSGPVDSGGASVDASHADAAPTSDAGHAGHTGVWKIMPFGDSITGSTCYPQLLSKELIAKGHTNFQFVGTNLNNQSCGTGAPNLMTEGHGGYDVTYLETNSPPQAGHGTLAELQTWAAEKPDVVLMEYATNDIWNGDSVASVLTAYGFVVDQFRSQNPDVIFYVAQITPLNPAGCTACETNVESLNSQIPGWASGKATAGSPIYVVNVWSSLPAATYLPNSTYTADGVHPNPAGSQLVADVWYTGITAQGLP